MAIDKRVSMFDVFGTERIPAHSYYGIQPYRSGDGRTHRYRLHNNMVIESKQIIVHTVNIGDVEDPDLMIADPIYKWQQTDHGKWVMENAVPQSPMWNRYLDPMSFGHKYMISAVFEGSKITEYYLRFGDSAQKRVPL